MRSVLALLFLLISPIGFAQNAAPVVASNATSATVPITLDHNRIIIDVFLALPDGTSKRVRGWVDNGNPELTMSPRVASLLGLKVTCNNAAQECSAPVPPALTIGGMKIPLSGVKQAKIPDKPASAAAVMAPGMSAEINIPSTILRNYDVLIDFPGREFTMARAGSIKFNGVSAKAALNPENGLLQIPSQIENKKSSLGLDLGYPISSLEPEFFNRLDSAHPEWPRMTGAVGPANLWGSAGESDRKLLRVERAQFGPLYLTDVPFASSATESIATFGKAAGAPTVGLIGSQALLNYRVGLDYLHSTVYFDIGSTFRFPDFDVVGLILRPEDDTRFTIIGVADFDGKPSVPDVQPGDHLVAVDNIPTPDSTMGQAWSALEGSPGQERKLTIERGGRQFVVTAKVCHFLGVDEEERPKKKSRGKN